jgi:hypothetical protein
VFVRPRRRLHASWTLIAKFLIVRD